MNSTSFDVELFITEVEKRPALYNKKLKEYTDKNVKEKLWTELCEICVENWHGLSAVEKKEFGIDLQKKWKNIRTCFKRECNAQKYIPPGPKGKRRRKYMYFDQLLFLMPTIEDKKTASNLQSPTDEESKNDVKTDHEIMIKRPKKLATDPTKKQLKQLTKSYEDQPQKIFHARKEDCKEIDEDKYFLLSLLPAFRKFDEDQKFMARMEILQTMRRVRLSGNLTSNYGQLTQPTFQSQQIGPTQIMPTFQASTSESLPGYYSTVLVNKPPQYATSRSTGPSRDATPAIESPRASEDSSNSDVSSIYSLG